MAPLHATLPWAIPQLEALRAAHLDVVIAAFGTNDLETLHETPKHIVGCYRRLVAAAAPARVLIATTPPMFPPRPDYHIPIDVLNALLAVAFPPDQLVDFHTGFERDLFLPDGLHLNDAGQRLRAERARAALLRDGTRP
jgi:lysophospholipase L1-like esterase